MQQSTRIFGILEGQTESVPAFRIYPLADGLHYEVFLSFADKNFMRIKATLNDPWWPLTSVPQVP